MATEHINSALSVNQGLVPCRKCGEHLPTSDFYERQIRKDKSAGECKNCTKKRVRERARTDPKVKEYDKWRYPNDPKVKERHRRYAKSPAGKEAFSRARSRWVKNNPEKRQAHVKFGNALRDGDVSRENQCQLCGTIGCRLDAHHFDYTKPLKVTWLCKPCHGAFHNYDWPIEDRGNK